MKKVRIHVSEGGSISEASVEALLEPAWPKIEKAYDKTFDSILRANIITVARNFISETMIEQNARPKNIILPEIKHLRMTAQAFKAAWTKLATGSDLRPARVEVRQNLRGLAASEMSATVTEVSKIIIACKRAEAQLKNRPGYVEGHALACLIKNLTNILKSRGLRTGAPHDRDRNEGAKRPPFVVLVHELQQALPREYRPIKKTEIYSLAKRITRARPFQDGIQRSRRNDKRSPPIGDLTIWDKSEKDVFNYGTESSN